MSRKSKYIQLLIVLAISLLSCDTKQIETLGEFKKWFADPANGYVKEKYINNLKYRIQYRPAELMLINELKNSTEKNQQAVNQLKEGYSEAKYFLVEIGFDERKEQKTKDFLLDGAITFQDYQQRVEQLAFYMKEQVRLQIGDHDYEPSIYHLERGYEVAKKTTMLFAFDVKEEPEEMTLVVNDEVFKTGINKFKFKDINTDVPEIPVKD